MLTVIGLLVSMAGDIAINYNFIAGAVIFALGHIFYFSAYTKLVKFSAKDLICILILFVPSALFLAFAPIFNFDSSVLPGVCIAYAFIISLMTGKSVSNLIFRPSSVTLVTAMGSLLFFFSDFMLAFRVFADAPRIFDWLCLMTYFPAQSVIAHSVYRYYEKQLHN